MRWAPAASPGPGSGDLWTRIFRENHLSPCMPLAEAQKREGHAAFIDAEHALVPAYAKNLSVNLDELYVSQPDTRRTGPGNC